MRATGDIQTGEDNNTKSPKSSGGSSYWLVLLGIIIAVEGAQRNRRLSEIRDAINIHNMLILKLMSGDDGELPADTMSYEEAQRLYVQTTQKPKLLQPVVYNK